MRAPTAAAAAAALAAAPRRAASQAPNLTAIDAAVRGGAAYARRALFYPSGKGKSDYHLTLGKWEDYGSLWHTAQSLDGLLHAYNLTADPADLAAARRAGDWWAAQRLVDTPRAEMVGLMDCRGDHHAERDNGTCLIGLATTTDGTQGIFHLSQVTGDASYADVATRAGDRLFDLCAVPGHPGLYYDNIWRNGSVLSPMSGSLWSNPNLLRKARPNTEGSTLRDMYLHTGREQYRSMFYASLDRLVETQDDAGMWTVFHPNRVRGQLEHPRQNCWYAESLVRGYDLSGNRTYLDAAASAMARQASFLRTDGTLYYYNHADGSGPLLGRITGSGVAHSLIVWVMLMERGVADARVESDDKAAPGTYAFAPPAARAARWLVTNRYPEAHPDANLAGGFIELNMQEGGAPGEPVELVHRDIATGLALRALMNYRAFCTGGGGGPLRRAACAE